MLRIPISNLSEPTGESCFFTMDGPIPGFLLLKRLTITTEWWRLSRAHKPLPLVTRHLPSSIALGAPRILRAYSWFREWSIVGAVRARIRLTRSVLLRFGLSMAALLARLLLRTLRKELRPLRDRFVPIR